MSDSKKMSAKAIAALKSRLIVSSESIQPKRLKKQEQQLTESLVTPSEVLPVFINNTQDEEEEEEEEEKDYKKGGYHPVHIGDVFQNGHYTVVRKLGWGHFSTVWLCLQPTGQPCALKIVKSAPHYTETALDEIKLLQRVCEASPQHPHRQYVVELYDSFQLRGPNGLHVAMAFEVMGPNLLHLIRQYRHKGIPLQMVRRIACQLLKGLDYLHSQCGIIHTDLKPENILLSVADVGQALATVGISTTINMAAAAADALVNDALVDESLVDESLVDESQELNSLRRHHSHNRMASQLLHHQTAGRPDDGTGSLLGSKSHSLDDLQPTCDSIGQSLGDISLLEASNKDSQPSCDASLVNVKIADLGNACWIDKHFTSDIQTRQYRSPEVIIGASYDCPADLWSLACILFELRTGDYLFDPKQGERFSKDDDHVAQIIELLGYFPKHFGLSGTNSTRIFNRKGELRHIHKLRFWTLESVLKEKYKYSPAEATCFAGFLGGMLQINPTRRTKPLELLKHAWLQSTE